MDGCRHCVPCSLERIEAATQRMESLMATQAEQISTLSGRVDGLTSIVGDVAADFKAFRDAVEADRENLSPSGQAALDAANTSLDTLQARVAELDVEVGDADGSDELAAGGGEVVEGGEVVGGGEPAGGDETGENDRVA
jgi:hypothetical protein